MRPLAAGVGACRRPRARRGRSTTRDPSRRRARPRGPAAHRCGAEPQHRVERRAQVVSRRRRLRAGRSCGCDASATGRVELIERYDVKAPGPTTPARQLSGGNLQKVVLGPRVLRRAAGARRRGADPRSRRRCDRDGARVPPRRPRRRRRAILLISEDLDEVLTLADRIAVMYEGAIVGEVDARTATVEAARAADGGRQERAVSLPQVRIEKRLRAAALADGRRPARLARRRASRDRRPARRHRASRRSTTLRRPVRRRLPRRRRAHEHAHRGHAARVHRVSRPRSRSACGCSTSAARGSSTSARSAPRVSRSCSAGQSTARAGRRR